MTDELIRTIAEKLNIAVDGAVSWLQMAIPQYCQMKAFLYAVPCLVSFAIFCGLIMVTTHYIKEYRRVCADNREDLSDFDWSYERGNAAGNCIAAGASAFIVFLFFCFVLTNAIIWSIFPDAMVLSTLISKC